MVKVGFLCQLLCVLSVLGGVELRARKGIIEDTGDGNMDFMLSYLDYEEPEYNQRRGFTKDDFTDHLKGFQTKPSIAKSFGWATSGYGEIPFAALLVSHERKNYCMGTVITTMAVVTPCACVKSAAFHLQPVSLDVLKRGNFREGDLNEYYFFDADLGDYFDIVPNHLEYNETRVGQDFYPTNSKVFSEKCFRTWSYSYFENGDHAQIRLKGEKGLDGYKRHEQLFYPAIVIVSRKLEFDVPCPWPPLVLHYTRTRKFEYDLVLSDHGEGNKTLGEISSYRFIPLEGGDLSIDNDARDVIKTEDQLVNLRVELCDQNLCNVSESFEKLRQLFSSAKILPEMICWCDVPWLGDEVIYQNVNNEDAPVYFKSVYGGLVGAPVVQNGRWAGWAVESVSREVSQQTVRPTLTRNVDNEMIAYFEEKCPELKSRNPPFGINPDADVIRGSFAVHDWKEFVPDADLKEEDLDLQGWAQIGNPRFSKPKKNRRRRRRRSGASTILPSRVPSLLLIYLILL